MRIVRLGLKPSLRLASCCRVEVVNGGAGRRLLWRLEMLRHLRAGVAQRGRMPLSGLRIADVKALFLALLERLAIDPDELADERLAAVGREDDLDRPVLTRGEGTDLALAIDDQAHGDRLDTAGRQAGMDLAPQQRAERVADQAVEDSPRLLRVDEVVVYLPWICECVANRVRA